MVNENMSTNTNPETGVKTFSQEDVNRIVSERLARERDKRSAELDEREKAVKARELAVVAVEKLTAAGLPKELASVLKYGDEQSLDAAISQLSNLRGFTNGQPINGENRKIIENKLPEPKEHANKDYEIREAFRLHEDRS